MALQAQQFNPSWTMTSLGFFVHPIPLSAVCLMAANDHWLKYQYPNWLTGKLSDFCGVFYLPIFILALAVGLLAVVGQKEKASRLLTVKNLALAILFTDFLLIIVKLSPHMASIIEDLFAQFLFEIQIIPDPTDLLALAMNPMTYLYMRSHLQKSELSAEKKIS
ncbi:MAG: hypothetical protein ACXWC9_01120 [Pseudobdellovibrionaceae bacterium]